MKGLCCASTASKRRLQGETARSQLSASSVDESLLEISTEGEEEEEEEEEDNEKRSQGVLFSTITKQMMSQSQFANA